MSGDNAKRKIDEETKAQAQEFLFTEAYSPLSLSEYLDILKLNNEKKKEKVQLDHTPELGAYDNSFFDRNNLTESSPARFYRMINEGKKKHEVGVSEYPFFSKGDNVVNGLCEVLDELSNRLYQASLLYKRSQIPLIMLVGPTGSGKTLIGRRLEEGMISDLEENPRYTFKFKRDNQETPIKCPINEDPLNLLTSTRSLVPRKIRHEFKELGAGDICSSCSNTYSELLIEKAEEIKNEGGLEGKLGRDYGWHNEDGGNTAKKGNPFTNLLDGIVEIVRLMPQSAFKELSYKGFEKDFRKYVENANRGILHITIDEANFDEIPKSAYQLLLSLADKRVSLENGSLLAPDVTVFLYCNEGILDDIKDHPSFYDRLLPVFVRRNLSFSEEAKIYSNANLPFTHLSPEILALAARFIIGTRIGEEEGLNIGDLFDKTAKNPFEELIGIYDRYETHKAITDKEFEIVTERLNIGSFKPPVDGWSCGLSPRKAVAELCNLSASTKSTCFTIDTLLDFMDNIEDNQSDFSGGDIELSKAYVKEEISGIVQKDITVAYLSILYEKDGGVSKVEELFNSYKSFIGDKYARGKQEVKMVGRGNVPIDTAITEVLERLKIKKKPEEFKQYYDGVVKQMTSEPAFTDLLSKHPDVISDEDGLSRFIDWNKLSRGLSLEPEQQNRITHLKSALRNINGYCDDCGDSALRYYSDEVLGRGW